MLNVVFDDEISRALINVFTLQGRGSALTYTPADRQQPVPSNVETSMDIPFYEVRRPFTSDQYCNK